MKIQDNKKSPKAAKAPANTKARPANAKSRPFAEALRKDQAGKAAKTEEPPRELMGRVVPGLLQDRPQTPLDKDYSRTQETSRVAVPTPPVSLQGLVSEIQLHVERGGLSEVEIQFNSNVFDGLNVKITREHGEIAIKFTTGSDSTRQLLAQQVPALTQALNSKGIAVSGISFGTGSGAGADSGGQFGSARGRQKKGR